MREKKLLAEIAGNTKPAAKPLATPMNARFRFIRQNNTLAGAGYVLHDFTVPKNKVWRVVSIHSMFVHGGAGGNRYVGAGAWPNAVLAASGTNYASIYECNYPTAITASAGVWWLPNCEYAAGVVLPWMTDYLTEGAIIEVFLNGQAADRLQTYLYYFEYGADEV